MPEIVSSTPATPAEKPLEKPVLTAEQRQAQFVANRAALQAVQVKLRDARIAERDAMRAMTPAERMEARDAERPSSLRTSLATLEARVVALEAAKK